jgi:murein tripeptide amidase MpaA
MKKFILTLLIVISTINAENIKQVKVYLDNLSDVVTLQKISVIDDHFIFDRKNSITFYVDEQQYTKLQNSGFRYEILIDDWKEYYKNRAKPDEQKLNQLLDEAKLKHNISGFDYGSMGGYLTMDEVYQKLDEMYSSFPSLITEKYEIGESIEGRKIYAVKISDNPNIDEDEPEVFFNSLIHAREPQGMMVLIYYMFYLLENYGIDDEATYLINNREIYFVPVFNVDGYEYNRTTDPNGGGYWRKNRRLNSDGSFGVDLNRNWGFEWGYDNNGSSDIPSDPTYRGTTPFSEPENQVVRDFVLSRNFKVALNYHTYSNLLIVPYGYENIETPDSLIFRDYAAEMTKYNNYAWGTSADLLYAVNGSTDDWMYGEQLLKEKIISMTPEVGNGSDGFWPNQDRIIPLAEENLYPNLFLTWVAGGYPLLESPNFSQNYFNPGETFSLNPKIKNVGLEKMTDISVTVSSLTEGLNITTNAGFTIESIESRETILINESVTLSLDEILLEDKVKIEFAFSKDGYEIRKDTVSIRIGTPEIIFEDIILMENDYWDFSSTSGINWKRTDNQYFSAPYSFTDSESGNYSANLTSRLTTKNSISLANVSSPILTFRSKWDIEAGWDCGKVQISTNNGSTWINLTGNYTSSASGDGAQTPVGTPVYQGSQSNWIEEEIDLSQFAGTNIKLRIELKSDTYIEEDGWYIDDIRISYYKIVPVELTSFTGSIIDKTVSLIWQTATETNNQGFEIYKSVDKINWNIIGFKEGKGTTASSTYYNFIDENPFSGSNYYRLLQIDYDGTVNQLSDIEVNNSIPTEFSLSQNYPNPFNPSTSIEYSIPSSEYVSLTIYDVLGNKVAELVNERKDAGMYKINFDASALTSGIYIYKLQAGSFVQTKKLMVLK